MQFFKESWWKFVHSASADLMNDLFAGIGNMVV